MRYCVGITMATDAEVLDRRGLYATLYKHQFRPDQPRPGAEPALALQVARG